LVGALAGAFAGAWAAQRIAERSKSREELTKEIRNINAGMTVALSIFSSITGLKKQHLKEMSENYISDREFIIKSHTKKNESQPETTEVRSIRIDLRNIAELSPPTELLKEIVFSRLSATERPLSLASAITEAIQNLNYSISARNNLIQAFKIGQFPPGADIKAMYFGLEYGDGHVNQEYGDSLIGMSSHTDDVIFFCRLLCKDLRDYGLRVAARYKKEFKKNPPTINEISFEAPQQEGLIPEDDNYLSWFAGFQKKPNTKQTFWKSLRQKVSGKNTSS
jgi:gas vesicle protein